MPLAVTVAPASVAADGWLEREQLILLDADPQVTGAASQPFSLHWHDGRRRRRHAPDYCVRLANGQGRVVDVRAADRVGEAAAEAFAAMEWACRAVGWEFVRAGVADPVSLANMRVSVVGVAVAVWTAADR